MNTVSSGPRVIDNGEEVQSDGDGGGEVAKRSQKADCAEAECSRACGAVQ